MDADTVLDTLTCCDKLPPAETEWAETHRDEMIPRLLAFLREYLDAPEDPEVPTPLLLALSFLASWRVKDAYRPIAEVLRSDPERLEWQFGEDGFDLASRFLRSVYDGDPRPILDILERETVDEFLRADMLFLLATLAHAGELDRGDLARQLESSFATLQPQARHPIWFAWTSIVAGLGLRELAPLAEQAFDRSLVDPQIYRRYDFREDLKRVANDPNDEETWSELLIEPFGAVAEELADWRFGGFSEEEVAAIEEGLPLGADDAGDWASDELEDEGEHLAGEPVVNPLRHVGRNDPCPCGSGKKYKKCCLPLHEKGV
jgi:hypothetical protein